MILAKKNQTLFHKTIIWPVLELLIIILENPIHKLNEHQSFIQNKNFTLALSRNSLLKTYFTQWLKYSIHRNEIVATLPKMAHSRHTQHPYFINTFLESPPDICNLWPDTSYHKKSISTYLAFWTLHFIHICARHFEHSYLLC